MSLQWRLTLDEPYSIAVEPGITKAVHCRNFRHGPGAFDNTWRDDVTGLVMLAPSFTKREWANNARALSTFRYSSEFWRRSRRSMDLAETFTTIKPQGSASNLIEITVDVAIMAIATAVDLYDAMTWALESTWLLAEDEGFALYLHNISDELIRKRNWLYIQWSNIGLHLGQDGLCRVYRYSEDMGAAPTQTYEFNLCSPSEISGRGSWFVCIPVPFYGLLIYHSLRHPRQDMLIGGATAQTARGQLVPWTGFKDIDGYEHVFSSSPIRIGLNPYQDYHVGVATLTYPSSGTYTDAVFDPGYKPSADPDTLAPILLPTDEQSVSASLRKADNSAAWAAGTDRKARARLSLSTSNTKHTPFVQGYGVVWHPVVATRNTTPVEATVRQLEITQDSDGRIEGSAEILAIDSDVQAIVKRGDATFLVESSSDGLTWTPEFAGLAKQFRTRIERYGTSQSMLVAECTITDMMERLRESHLLAQTAFDGMTVGNAINVILSMGGFEQITVPEPLNSRQVPISKSGETWRFAVKLGDTGEEILNKLLVLGRRQHQEWIAVHDPDTWRWSVSVRPRDTATRWTLTQDSGDHDVSSRIVCYRAASYESLPPECNSLRVMGVTSPDPKGEKIIAYAINRDSLDDDSSLDYLGRIVLADYVAEEALTQGEVNMIARKIEARAMHHALRAHVDIERYVSGLEPNVCVDLLDRDDSTIAPLWVKRRTLTITGGYGGYREQMTLELDTIWENPIA